LKFDVNTLFENPHIMGRFNLFLDSHERRNRKLFYRFLLPGDLPSIYVPNLNLKDMQFSGLAVDPTAVPFLTYDPGMVPLFPTDASAYLERTGRMAPTVPVLISGDATKSERAVTPLPSTSDMLKVYIYQLFKNLMATASYIDVNTFLLSIRDGFYATVEFIYEFLRNCVLDVAIILRSIYYFLVSIVNFIAQGFALTGEAIKSVMIFCVDAMKFVAQKIYIGSKFMFKMFKDFATLFSGYISAFNLASIYNSLVVRESYQVSAMTAQLMDEKNVREKRRIESEESEGQMSPAKITPISRDSAFSDYYGM
jgi:hypothetical protein